MTTLTKTGTTTMTTRSLTVVRGDGRSKVEQIPTGDEGTLRTLEVMRDLVVSSMRSNELRQRAANLASLGVSSIAIWSFMKRHFRFSGERSETLHEPTFVDAILRKSGVDRGGGNGPSLVYVDCDEVAMYAATLLELTGHPTAFVVTSRDGGEFEHVFVSFQRYGDWMSFDPQETSVLGAEVPSARRTSLRLDTHTG